MGKGNPESLGKVAVLMGGLSGEREVSLMSGAAVLEALRGAGVDAFAFDPGRQTFAELLASGATRAFNLLHGAYGEDGAIQGVLEWLGIPYTGSGVRASALTMDKVRTVRFWDSIGLPVPKSRCAHADISEKKARKMIAELGGRLVVKPSHGGSSIGLTRLESATPETLVAAVRLATREDRDAAVEEFIEGRELTVTVLGEGDGAKALPIIEIRAPGGDYDYKHKYFVHDVVYECPARIDEALSARIREAALKAYCAAGCRTWGRIDVMLRADGDFRLLEANTAPGMTGHSLVPMAAAAAGIDYTELVLRIAADVALENRR